MVRLENKHRTSIYLVSLNLGKKKKKMEIWFINLTLTKFRMFATAIVKTLMNESLECKFLISKHKMKTPWCVQFMIEKQPVARSPSTDKHCDCHRMRRIPEIASWESATLMKHDVTRLDGYVNKFYWQCKRYQATRACLVRADILNICLVTCPLTGTKYEYCMYWNALSPLLWITVAK